MTWGNFFFVALGLGVSVVLGVVYVLIQFLGYLDAQDAKLRGGKR